MSRIVSQLGRLIAAVVLVAAGFAPVAAQGTTGRIEGTVVDGTGAAVRGAQVVVVGTTRGAITDGAGTFTITGVPLGARIVRVVHLAYREATTGVNVSADARAAVTITLEAGAVELGGLVVSASRKVERVTDAPATISRIDAARIDRSVGNTFAGALKEVVGLDFIQTGINSAGVNARGFNSSFNNRMLMIEDGRVAVLPESGLPVGGFTTVPKIDLAGMEVLVGPGAALYGADASSGVLNMQTKDPRQFPGTTVEVTGGNRKYRDVQFRHAAANEGWGFKVAGEYLAAEDWDNALTYRGLAGGRSISEDKLPIPIDWNTEVTRGTATLARYMGEGEVSFTGGYSKNNGVGQTNVGRNQFKDWTYNVAQLRYSRPGWYFTAYRTQSQSGESFALNRMASAWADAQHRNLQITADSMRLLSDWPSDGRMYAAELQNTFSLPVARGTEVTWGGQYRQDVVSSKRQWLTDRRTGEDLEIAQYGLYAQTKTPLVQKLDLILAGRIDKHENYDQQFSPKAGLVFRPSEAHAVRATYNRAFKSPTILQTNFFIPDWTSAVSILGNTQGFEVRREDGSVVRQFAALEPEENVTYELGYKGVLAQRLFLDVTYYRSDYTNFISPLVIISDPYGFNLAGDGAGVKSYAYQNGTRVLNHNNAPPILLIYYNLGEATISGVDAGANFVLTPKVNLRGTFSRLSLDDLVVPPLREEATSLNAPETKFTVGAEVHDIGAFFGGATVRQVGEYYFRSGINKAVIPGFTTLDLSLGYRMPWQGATLQLSVNNLFSCGGEFTYAGAATDPHNQRPVSESRACGSGRKHFEMVNMPKVGTTAFLGVRYQR